MPDSIVISGTELTDLTYAFTEGGTKEVRLVVTSPEQERVSCSLSFNLPADAQAGSIGGPDAMETGQNDNFSFIVSPNFAVYC